jgi:hypothetical protein
MVARTERKDAMDRLLKRGDVFSCEKFENLVGTVVHRKVAPAKVDFTDLHFDSSDQVEVRWTELAAGGWTREHKQILDTGVKSSTLAKKIGKMRFRVVSTYLGGGGTGHGPHDVYPDGHHVTAATMKGRIITVKFYQTGCFIGMVDPKDITLHEEDT